MYSIFYKSNSINNNQNINKMNKINFVEFRLANCDRNIVVNISMIMNFFEMGDGTCTIVMSSDETFPVKHKYTDVINMIQYYENIFIARSSQAEA